MKYQAGLTDEQIAAYMKSPNECPFCQSEEIIPESFFETTTKDGDVIANMVCCQNCWRIWEDLYKLIRPEPIEQECARCGKKFQDGESIKLVGGKMPALLHAECSKSKTL